ncbi:MAG: Flp pilus assembly complex ATPase component TadA, partial [Alphaproteobacteria bacterium]|nr:Flp pilus assembly complex ATPase component TadA [Alphaproteobacteria bacterium]
MTDDSTAPKNPETNIPVHDVDSKKAKRIGDILVEQGLITLDQLNVALHEKQKTGKMIGATLVDLGFISESMLTGFLAESTGYQQFDPKKTMLDPEALGMILKKDALKYQLLPVSFVPAKNEITIAMADPYDVVALDRLKQLLPRGIELVPQICAPAIIVDAIHRAYGVTTSIDGILKELEGDKAAAKKNIDNLSEEEAYSHPIVRLVNAMIFEAVKMGASDLHFEPEEFFVRARYRLDGDLIVAHTFHREYWSGICQRLKIMSQMNIADKLSPQDGRFSMNMGGREADFRVAALPTVDGENIVLRVLDKNASIVPLEKLAFSEHNMHLIRKALARPEGMIIVTGPTGSGKTTTLYSMLSAVNTPDVNIMTLEDPVEYSLGLIRQSSVREGTGLSFSDGVKALLRQDPDIIFVGEVRDGPTAEQALAAAMTGHQVFTSLHTNDS